MRPRSLAVMLTTLAAGSLWLHAGAPARADGPPTFQIHDVGSLGAVTSTNSYTAGLGDGGHIIGTTYTPAGARAFIYHPATGIVPLGTLGGSYSYPSAVNASGQVTGFSSTGAGSGHAFLWQSGVMFDLGDLAGGNGYSEAWMINSAGQVAGVSAGSDGYYHAFLWDSVNGMRDLGRWGGWYANPPIRLNEAGQVAFTGLASNGQPRAMFWDGAALHDVGDLGSTSYPLSYARGLSAAGHVIGASYTPSGRWHGFVWQGGVITDLGELGGGWSEAWDVNSSGQVVGISLPSTGDGYPHVFLWDPNTGVMTDLGRSASWMYNRPVAINEAGRIAYNGFDSGGYARAMIRNGAGPATTLATLGGSYTYAAGLNANGQVAGRSLTSNSGGQWHAVRWAADGAVQDLGTLGGGYSEASFINAIGHVAGGSYTSEGQWHAFGDYGGGMQDAGSLSYTYSDATGLNAQGKLIGVSQTPSGYQHAYLYETGSGIADLGTLPGGRYSHAQHINAQGHVVGQAEIQTSSGYASHSFFFDGSSMQDIGTLGGGYSWSSALSDAGHVVGASYATSGQYHAFLWVSGDLTDLGSLAGPGGYSYAHAVNNAGHVVGWASTPSGRSHAFLWQGGTMTDLGDLAGGNGYSEAWTINSAGQVAGVSTSSDGTWHAFLWDSVNGMRDLGPFSWWSWYNRPLILNESGQVAFSGLGGDNNPHAILWDGAALRDLGTLGGWYSFVEGLSSAGHVVGASLTASGEHHAFLWEDGAMTDLGTLGGALSHPVRVNAAGTVVGVAARPDGSSVSAIWQGGQLRALSAAIEPGSGWGNIDARLLNDNDEVAGSGISPGLDWHAFLLTPKPSDASAPTTTTAVSPSATNGWNRTDVTVTLSAVDNAGGAGVREIVYSVNGSTPVTATLPSVDVVIGAEGENIITFHAVDQAGNAEADQTLTIKIDKTAPTISGTATPAANAEGWNNTDVAVTFTASDSLSGLASVSEAVTLSEEGAGQSVTGTATDNAGNTAQATVTGISIDKTPPIIAITPGDGSAIELSAGIPTPTHSVSDALSSVASTGSGSLNSAGAKPSGVGAYVYSVTGASDKAGNAGSAASTYSVVYGSAFQSFRQPINSDGSSIFKLGSTIPVKFQLMVNGASVGNASAGFAFTKISDTVGGAVNESATTLPGDSTAAFRYDPSAGQYIYNWSTKGLTSGTYRVWARLDDGTLRSVVLGLRP